MGVFGRGRSPTAIIRNGVHATKIYVGEIQVWDGTRPALVNMVRAHAGGSAPTFGVSADSVVGVPVASAAGVGLPPAVGADAFVTVPVVAGAAGIVAPVVVADSVVVVPACTAAADAHAPTGAEQFDVTVVVPVADGSAEASVFVVGADFDAAVPAAVGTAEAPAPAATATGSALVGMVVATGSAAAVAPGVSASSPVLMPAATSAASAPAPGLSLGGSAALPVATGTAAAAAPLVYSGLLFSDNFNRADGTLSTPWVRRVSWTYDNFAISSNQLYRTGSGGVDTSDGTDAYIWGAATVTANQFSQLYIATISGFPSAGVVLGTDAGGTTAGLWAEVSTSGWRIFSAVPASGSKTILASGAGTYTAGGVLRLEKSGNVATLRYKGAVLGTYTGTLPSGLYVGVRAGQGSCRSDDWSGGDL